MKKIITIGVFFVFFAISQSFSQSFGKAVGASNCSSVYIVDPGINTSPRTTSGPLLYLSVPNFSSNVCAYFALPSEVIDVSARQFRLFKVLDQNNPDPFNNLYPLASNSTGTFQNLDVGTYLIDVFDAWEEKGWSCFQSNGHQVNAPFKVFNGINGQSLGWAAALDKGVFGVGPLFVKGSHRYTQYLHVGQSRLVDNDWEFIGQKGYTQTGGIMPIYGSSDIVKIDATKAKNYNRYGIGIQEFWADGTPGRWRGKGNGGYGGFIDGSLAIENLSDIWEGGTGWTFLNYNKYRVQVVIYNTNCTSWTQELKSFVICDASCRVGGESQMMSISPNPASNKFKINGIDFDGQKEYQVLISDISGKTIQNHKQVTSDEFDTNNLSNGLYMVQLFSDNRKLFSSKLIISK